MATVTEIKRGATFSQVLTCLEEDDVAVDMSGWSFASELRAAPGKDLLIDFAIDDSAANVGELTMSATAAETAALDASCKLQYDIKFTTPASDVYYSETVFLLTSKHITD